jgi:hypothetical protein
MNTTRQLAHAAILAAGFLAAPLFAVGCPADQAKPFTSGPLDAQGMFSQWVVDSNGVGLTTCTDSVTADGNPPPCFYDPAVLGNALSQTLGRGNEAFMFLANSVFTTVGANPVDAVVVMGVETAFLSAEPQVGFQTQFQRLRTRLNVNALGRYTVETPWRTTTYIVDTLLAPGNGQNRAEISDPIDITFGTSASVPGMVAPFLTANPALPGTAGYIGDGLTLTTVTGSPCGANFVRVTAVGLDGLTPIDINNGSNVYTEPLFTVMGKLTPVAPTPLAITSAFYTRNAGATSVTAMAEGSSRATAVASLSVGTSVTPMSHDATRFYASTPVVGVLPTGVSITTSDPSAASQPNTQSAPLRDLVTIGLAEARCSGTGLLRNCLLTVNASSSDDGSGGVTPTLTLQHLNSALINGAIASNSKAVPASVTVTSSAGGAAVKPVTVINQ